MPNDIRTYIVFVMIFNAIVLILALVTGDTARIILTIIWTVAVGIIYSQLVKKKNWARIALIIITFPIGLILALSQEAKLYVLQKG